MCTCERCGYNSATKSNLLKHLRNKKPCQALSADIDRVVLIENLLKDDLKRPHVCGTCSKRFTTSSSKSRHQKLCKIKPSSDMNSVLEVVNDLQNKVKELENKLGERDLAGPTTNYNTTNNNSVVNNIIINAFGKEDISYLTEHKGFKKFMINCIRNRAEGVVDFIAKKHFHPDHPENHNVRKLNKKDDFIEVKTGKEWKTRFSEDVVSDLMSSIEKEFMKFVESAFLEDGSLNKQWLDVFMKSVGVPLEWDLDTEEYEYICNNPLSDDEKDRMLQRIYRLVIEDIYKRSKSVHMKLKTFMEA